MSPPRTAAQLRHAAAGMFVDDRELLKALASLDGKQFNRALSSATNKATTPVLKDARRNLKATGAERTGLLYRSLGKKNKHYKRSHTRVSIVGPRHGFKARVTWKGRYGMRTMYANPVNYAHLIEGGHRGRGRFMGRKGRAGVRPGRVIARPFISKAWNSNRTTLEKGLRSAIGVNVLRTWDKATRGGA